MISGPATASEPWPGRPPLRRHAGENFDGGGAVKRPPLRHPSASGDPAGFISLMNGWAVFVYPIHCVCLNEPLAAFSCPITLALADNHMLLRLLLLRLFFFLASLGTSAATARHRAVVKFYDLLILIQCCVSLECRGGFRKKWGGGGEAGVEERPTPLLDVTRFRCVAMTSAPEFRFE